mmetsp:Transcript_40479/g.99419  ORF Transcript_40479/g.99419 Transcript_40479/m.99419 type:complete len:313 (+) Transcript_40479:141-1079(+)
MASASLGELWEPFSNGASMRRLLGGLSAFTRTRSAPSEGAPDGERAEEEPVPGVDAPREAGGDTLVEAVVLDTWPQFEAEFRAVKVLREQLHEFAVQVDKVRTQRLALADQFLLFFPRQGGGGYQAVARQVRAAAARGRRPEQSLSVAIQVRFRRECLEPCDNLLRRFERVATASAAKQELLRVVAKYEQANREAQALCDSSAVVSDDLEESALRLKSVINSYYKMEADVQNSCGQLHARLAELVQPILVNWVDIQRQLTDENLKIFEQADETLRSNGVQIPAVTKDQTADVSSPRSLRDTAATPPGTPLEN